jgi:hypothetical protein
MNIRWKKRTGYALTVLMPALIGLSWYLQSYYVDARPTRPMPHAEQVVPLNVHGTTVYLTKLEYMFAEYAFFVGMLSGFAGGALLQSARRSSSDSTA